MKTFKKIFYTIFGLFIATIVGLVGVILYAEYSGQHFSAKSLKSAEDLLPEDDSRLAYDENGNIAEFPGGTPGEVLEDGENTQMPPVDTTETGSDEIENEIEQVYIMDMGANLFHTKDCSEVENIKDDDLLVRINSTNPENKAKIEQFLNFLTFEEEQNAKKNGTK